MQTKNFKNYLIFYFDVLTYPPILSLIEILLDEGNDVTLLSYCSDTNNIEYLIKKGLTFIEIVKVDNSEKKILKFFKYEKFRKIVNRILSNLSTEDKVWYIGNETIFLFTDVIKKNNSILYFFELPHFKVPSKYRFWTNNFRYKNAIRKADKVINCEINRGMITKSYFGLNDKQNVIIPNKTNFKVSQDSNIVTSDLVNGLEDKKIILYQGALNYPERRLDELCLTIELLPEEFVIVIMGPETPYKQSLKNKYESNRVMFFPYIKAPHHLQITKLARIGFLTYFPVEGEIEQVLNVAYCAPNKIFEYAQFSIPMVSNMTPSLNTVYQEYKCGIGVSLSDIRSLAETILTIDRNYDFYSKNSKIYFDSVDIKNIIANEILN